MEELHRRKVAEQKSGLKTGKSRRILEEIIKNSKDKIGEK